MRAAAMTRLFPRCPQARILVADWRPPVRRVACVLEGAWMLCFRLLGPVEAWEGDRQVDLGGQRQRALLALLLLSANRVVPTDTLVEALWGEEPPRTATTSLHNAVSQL